jgi:hypothetical protein
MPTSKLFLLAGLSSLYGLIGCAMPEDGLEDECADGKCDVAKTPCDGIMIDKSGNKMKNPARSVDDPFAKAVLHAGDTCPTTFSEIMDKLRENDKEGCTEERDGIETRVISETAQAQGKATNYRAVVTRTCNNRSTDGIVFSLFGLSAGAAKLPEAVEIIAFDETEGVFNYYETDGSELHFFGSSKDMLKGPGQNGDKRCANCHVAGGLVMKELDTPWLHWEGHMDTPGAEALIKKHKNLGSQTSGAELEGLVKGANEKWNKTRIATLKAAGKVDELLKPLFCSTEFNLDNGADFESPVLGGPGGSELSRIPFDVLLDPQLKSFGSISVEFSDYDAKIKANGQKLNGIPGAIDTVFDYVFPERAHIDNDYVEQLVAAGIIDADFVKDVLMVDFTRPVFSDDRCALAAFAPQLSAEDLKADKIRDGFIAALEAESPTATSPGGVLLKNLKTAADATAHDGKVDAFVAACTALGSSTFLDNQLKITSLIRDISRESPIMEFEQTMPDDTLNVNRGARLDPKTCQLTNAFVAP